MSDIVERLKGDVQYEWRQIMREAAAEITRLRAELAAANDQRRMLADAAMKLDADLALWRAEALAGRELDIISHESPRAYAWHARHHAARLKLEAAKSATDAGVKGEGR